MSNNAAMMHCPRTREATLELLGDHGEDAKLVAGGTAFTILRKAGLLQPDHVVSLGKVPGLDQIAAIDGAIRLGALVTLRTVERSRDVRRQQPVLAAATGLVANARIRNVATVGGNISEADPTSDPPTVLTALDAVVRVASRNGERDIPMREFQTDYFETVLGPDELVTEVVVPALTASWGGTYLKFLSRSAEDRTCLGVAAFVDSGPDGACQGLRLAVGGAGPIPLRLPEVEQRANGTELDPDTVAGIAADYVAAADPVSDLRGSAEYRKRVLGTLIPRAIERAQRHENDAVLR